jgi:hypothetical protein
MKIVRVRISGWVIQRGNQWMSRPRPSFFYWVGDRELAHVFKRLSEAEAWVLKNS